MSQKLSANAGSYIRPKKTITETVQTKEAIEEKLDGFEEVEEEDINFITIGTQLRYLSYDPVQKKELFRFGGILDKIAKEYMVLKGKEGKTFSVQRYTKDKNGKILHTTRFFKKMKKETILQNAIDEQEETISKVVQEYNKNLKIQQDAMEKMKKENMALKKRLEASGKK